MSDQEVLTRLIDLYDSNPGRRLFALREVRAIAEELGDAALIEAIEEAIAKNQLARTTQGRWRHDRNIDESARGRAATIDHDLDRTLGVLHTTIDNHRKAYPDTEIAEKASRMLETLFPDGVAAITTRAFEPQLSDIRFVLEELRGEWSQEVQEMNLGRLLDRLTGLADAFDEALSKQDNRQVTWDEVREADNAGQQAMLRVVAKILGRYADPDQAETRRRLVGPILEQDDRIAELHRRHRQVTDVDPETGEEEPADPSGESGGDGGQADGGESSGGDSDGGQADGGESSGGDSDGESSGGDADSETPET